MKKMGVPEVIDRSMPRHWKQEGLAWGWVGTVWLAHIIAAGWRAFATTNAPAPRLALGQAGQTYRDEFVIEHRGCARLKGAPLSISPLFVKNEDQIIGLTHLLTLAVSVLNLIEFVARRHLHASRSALLGLHPEKPRKATTLPTAERLLRVFKLVRLVILRVMERPLSISLVYREKAVYRHATRRSYTTPEVATATF